VSVALSALRESDATRGSKVVVLPQPLLDQLDLGETEEVELTLTRDGVLVAPHRYLNAESTREIGRTVAAKRAHALKRLAQR
jgi:antitoxin component of MazEF toxin-antitoxin module